MISDFILHYQYALFAKRQSVVEGIEALCKYSGNFSMRLHKEYSMRLDVLRRLGFIDLSDLVTLKGRVAIEVCCKSPLV